MLIGRIGALAVVGVLSSVAVASAQPLAADPQQSSAPGSTTTMPVAVDDATETMAAERSDRTSEPPPIALEKPIDPATYLCGPGDVFELNFWGRQNFRLQITADLEGNAFISKIGFVSVTGKSLTVVRAAVRKKVQREYPGLGFELTLTKPRTFLVHLVENVKNPGAYTASALERVGTIIARAGGLAGSRRRITIKRAGGAQLTADLVMYELTGDTSFNPYVLDGDVIMVPAAQVSVSIAGPVLRPGTYELIGTKDLSELVQLAGGLRASTVRTLPIRIIRRNQRQQQKYEDVPFTNDVGIPNAPLRDDDEVFVRSSLDLQRSVLLIGAVVGADPLDQATTSKRLPFVEGDTVWSLIDRAGGIRAPGDLKRSFLSRPRRGEEPLIIPLDLDVLLVQRNAVADMPIQMNDSIVVPPMRHAVLVEGAVARPGAYTFNPRFGVLEYLAHAGGRTRIARDEDEIQLIDSDGRTRPYKRGARLNPGDAILVPERNFSRPEVVQIAIAVAGLVLSGVAVTIAVTR